MKIGIMTLPLHNNYGGILQNYALQKVLNNLGHETITINRIKKMSFFRKIFSIIKRVPKKVNGDILRIRVWQTKKEKRIIGKNSMLFIKENIKITDEVTHLNSFKVLSKYKLEAIIVGSDQVWRKKYSPSMSNYFLDFAYNTQIKKIAYAASFGVDKWEYNKAQTEKYKKLISNFDAVSVREESAVGLCKNYLNTNAIHVLDPTLLLDKEDYINLIKHKDHKKRKGILFSYILDKSDIKINIIDYIAKEKNLVNFEIMPEIKFCESNKNNFDKCIFPPIENWIRSFMDAEFIITDSYHGTIFSIIFQKPFVTIGNKSRGLTRFSSLLNSLKLNDRLIDTFELNKLKSILSEQINWHEVNSILSEKRAESFKFINNNIYS